MHWEIEKIKDVSIFFSKLTLIFPNDVYLCIVDGQYSSEIKSFIKTYGTNDPVPPLTSEFRNGSIIQINDDTMSKLADISKHHAEPEIATHICVCNKNERLLEQFDFPEDPIAISLKISEESVHRFCEAISSSYGLASDKKINDFFTFYVKKLNNVYELHFEPITFTEAYPVIAKYIKTKEIAIFEYSPTHPDEDFKHCQIIIIKTLKDKKHNRVEIIPTTELKKLSNIGQYNLNWISLNISQDENILSKIDNRILETKMNEYKDLFHDHDIDIMFSSHDDEYSYLLTKQYQLAIDYFEYMFNELNRQANRSIVINKNIIGTILGITMGKRSYIRLYDIHELGKLFSFKVWIDPVKEISNGINVEVDEKGRVNIQDFINERTPQFRTSRKGSWWGCLLVFILPVVLYFLIRSCKYKG